MAEVIAVFVASDWLDQPRLKVWAKKVPKDAVVLLTDDPSDGNTVLARQLRACEELVIAVVRTPGTRRSPQSALDAWVKRDATMIAIADRIVVFGQMQHPQLLTGAEELYRER
jgi:hypothetical protein